MPKLKTPPIPRDYLTRHELLAMVPLGMTSIDQLEKKGIFPKRFRLLPLKRVAWPRREVSGCVLGAGPASPISALRARPPTPPELLGAKLGGVPTQLPNVEAAGALTLRELGAPGRE